MRGPERPAAGADEDRSFRRQRMRAHRHIVLHQRQHVLQHRHHAGLVALAGDDQHVAFARAAAPRGASGRALRRCAGRSRRAAPSRRRRAPRSRDRDSSPARSSASAKRFAAAIGIGFGRVLPTFGARIAESAPTLPLPSRSRNRPNERRPASARISERPPISSARRIAMKALTSLASSAAKRASVTARAPVLAEKVQTLPEVARIGLQRLRRQPSLGAQMRQPMRHLAARGAVGAGEFDRLDRGSWLPLAHAACCRAVLGHDDSADYIAPLSFTVR